MSNTINNSPDKVTGLSKLGDLPIKEAAFNADDAMMGALNYQIDMLMQLSELTVSLGDMQATMQKEGSKNAQSKVEMYRKLLSAQTLCQNPDLFKNIVKEWGNSSEMVNKGKADGNLDEVFMNWLDSKGQGHIFRELYENPDVSKEDKILFAQQFSTWAGESDGRLSTYLGLSSGISANLQDATYRAQDWQSFSDSMKPTQVQQAIATLIAEIGQSTSAWEKVVAM